MIEAKEHICPRCLGPVPNAEHKGEYVGALSRISEHEICSACGTDEAMRDYAGLQPILPIAWPIKSLLPITVGIESLKRSE